MSYVLPLRGLTRADVSLVGAKAANLGELASAGFPVPDGFTITTEAFDRFLKLNALEKTQTPETVLDAEMPLEIEDALRTAFRDLDGNLLAVRSSGLAEDLEGASFAGQYETILGVHGYEALVNAVRQCWASAFSVHVVAYKRNKEQAGHASMAVLVQQLVPADAAGVAFSANPVNGRRDETVVSAVRGLGERLVSGEASPDEWIVNEGNAVRISASEKAIDENQVQDIAEMARKAEAHFGSPQDIEWAIADGKLFMLQSRPITTLPEPTPKPIPVPDSPPPGFWERDSTHFPEPLSPMIRSAVLPAHERALFTMLEELALPMDGVQYQEIGGWTYQRIIPLGGKDLPPPPSWLMPILIRVVPQLRKMVKEMVGKARADIPWKNAERWYAEWKPDTIARLNDLKKVALPSLPDRELEQHVDEVLAFVLERVHIHMLVTTADILVSELMLACQELLGWDGCKSLELLSGLSGKTTEPTYRLAELVFMAQERPDVRQLFDPVDHNTPRRLAEVDSDFAAAVERYLEEFGGRTLRWDLNEPTVAEKPELVLRLIRDQIANGYDPEAEAAAREQKRAAVLAEARQLLASRSDEDSRRFEYALARAERAYPIREDHEFYLTNAPFALLRYALIEVGKRMTERRQLDHAEDIMFLELEEAQAGFRELTDLRATVSRRKGELAWAKAHPGPAYYGKVPPSPPSFDAFPSEARQMMQVVFMHMESVLATQHSQQSKTTDGTNLHGLAASSGQYTGPARIIMSESEFGKLQAGDVLVCPTTQPPWSVLFPSVGALVTDSGGILSHPAIIAREYGIPAVVATGNATKLVKDGQVVIVDGDSGIMQFVE